MTRIMHWTKQVAHLLPVLGLVCVCGLLLPKESRAQGSWQLDKMPPDLETELALSALPPHLRAGATVYLLDPAKAIMLRAGARTALSVLLQERIGNGVSSGRTFLHPLPLMPKEPGNSFRFTVTRRL